MKNFPDIGVQIGQILLPAPGVDLYKWAVIACDQYTSQPEYWERVSETVSGSPSTLELILPEVYLNTPEEKRRISSTQAAMKRYLDEKILVPYEGIIFVEREVEGKTRRGIMLALDLEKYDFSKGSQSLIRATEGTIVDRLPPRIRIREGALLEVPHILVLIDDPQKTVIEPLVEAKPSLKPLYDVELMQGSGHLRGYLVENESTEQLLIAALKKLAEPQHFQQAYLTGKEHGVLLFAVGDGNHSLATAKTIWEKLKPHVGPDHPARYALVEIENVHDAGLEFEPIHRVIFQADSGWKNAMLEFFQGNIEFKPVTSLEAMREAVHSHEEARQAIGIVTETGIELAYIQHPPLNLAVGTLQSFLDSWLKAGGAGQIDYVHGDEVVAQLGSQPGNLGFYLPAIDKGSLFKTVILDGSLPRKTFSMGEAHEKRFYMESRRIA